MSRTDQLLAASAIGRRDPATPGILAGALGAARRGGFLNTVEPCSWHW